MKSMLFFAKIQAQGFQNPTWNMTFEPMDSIFMKNGWIFNDFEGSFGFEPRRQAEIPILR